jgi:hypothetical protein
MTGWPDWFWQGIRAVAVHQGRERATHLGVAGTQREKQPARDQCSIICFEGTPNDLNFSLVPTS